MGEQQWVKQRPKEAKYLEPVGGRYVMMERRWHPTPYFSIAAGYWVWEQLPYYIHKIPQGYVVCDYTARNPITVDSLEILAGPFPNLRTAKVAHLLRLAR